MLKNAVHYLICFVNVLDQFNSIQFGFNVHIQSKLL